MSENYRDLLEKDFARQIKYLHIDEYHKLGYKGKGITILNAEGASDHREMTSGVIQDYAPEATLLESHISAKTKNNTLEHCTITINNETLDLEDAINKYNIKIITRSYAGSSSTILLDYFKYLQKTKGVIFVNSAGNKVDDTGMWVKDNTAIAVSASTLKKDGTIKISYYGSEGEVDFTCFMAKGRGTSASSPALASIIALLLQRYGDFNQNECVEILKSISLDLEDKLRFGYGLPILPLTDKLEKLEEIRRKPIEKLPKEEELEDVKNEGDVLKKVMIDSGHYPNHPNKGQTGYWEYQGVWKISNYLKEFLEKQGVQADLTKTYEETFNNDANLTIRGKKAQDYDLFISEHTNAYNQKTQGVEVFYDYSKPQDKIYAEELSLAVSKIMNNPNRCSKTRTYDSNGITYNYYGVIRGASATNCPHIFLIESGYHDNLIDEAFLKVDDNLKKIAQVQANVILKILGIEVKEMTFDIAKKTIQDKAGLDNNSMQYLEFY
ncbi:MAG: N-acetylmuramoyl-L-alanine amidase, partial [Tissierellia bacterium]|nr:N-acetylmuramoyl-L-alanine amidase [Tissierellia bacterium]